MAMTKFMLKLAWKSAVFLLMTYCTEGLKELNTMLYGIMWILDNVCGSALYIYSMTCDIIMLLGELREQDQIQEFQRLSDEQRQIHREIRQLNKRYRQIQNRSLMLRGA